MTNKSMIDKSMIRDGLHELDTKFSRRAFFHTFMKGAGLVAAYDQYGPKLFGADFFLDNENATLPYRVYSAIGNIVIPVDDDPGWATFEPDITNFGVDVFVRQILLGGNYLAFVGFLSTMAALNQLPLTANYGFPFLTMTTAAQNKYFSDILTGKFENDGYGDVAGFASGLSLLSTKATFFSNFPDHLAYPGAEFQVRKPKAVKTGWDIMGLRGPVGPDEETALRAKFYNSVEIPGVDPTNQYI